MDIPVEGVGGPDEAVTSGAPWGINPATNRPYTKSPEERAAVGAQLAAARKAKAEARQAAAAAAGPDPDQAQPIDRSVPDREPGRGKTRRGRRGRASDPEAKQDIPPFKAGPIAKGMNRLYAKAGRLVKLVNPMFGEAIISVTRKESDDDETVGEAWEALAQVNPVWRVRLLKICTGGAAGRVFMAHMPILLALLMLEPVQKRMPFGNVVNAVFGEDEPATPDATGPVDLDQMMAMATQMMGPLIAQRAASMPPRTPDLANGFWPAGENPDGSFGSSPAEAAA